MRRVLVTGSAGHLGEGLVRVLRDRGVDPVAIDVLESEFTTVVGSITDRDLVRRCMRGVDLVLHTATLHKPHVATHSRQAFVDTNITGTLNLLEEAVAAGVGSFVFTSTTSAFGRALVPELGEPATWITEDVRPLPKNIYGVTKSAAEDLCELFHRLHGLPCVILRTSRFFLEEDDDPRVRLQWHNANIKANELLHRRVDLQDVVEAHLLAGDRASTIGCARLIISATTPFSRGSAEELRTDARAVVRRLFPDYEAHYGRRGWRMYPSIERVYDNSRARAVLGWRPRYDFRHLIDALARDDDPSSPLARAVGSKGYHHESFEGGPYPV